MLTKPAYRVGLAQWQTLCVENYLRARRLERACKSNGFLRLELERGAVASITLASQGPYTADMTLVVQQSHALLRPTTIDLRLYHDLRLAEVMSMSQDARTLARNRYPNRKMHQPDEKWQWNLYLSEWLRYLGNYGNAVVPDKFWPISRSAS